MNINFLRVTGAIVLGIPLIAGAQRAPQDPADPKAPASALQHSSAFQDFKSFQDLKAGDWRKVNDTVGMAAGSTANSMDKMAMEPAAPVSATAPTKVAPASHHQHEVKK